MKEIEDKNKQFLFRLTSPHGYVEEYEDIAGADLSYVLEMGSSNGVLPLVYGRLSRLYAGHNASNALMLYSGKMLAIHVRNEFLLSRAKIIIELLEKESLCPVLFKGPEIAVRAFGGIGMRQFDDIDLVLDRDSLIKARGVLLGKGFHDK
jgi:hypothetical protein